jgi:type II secretory pathway component PulF
LRNKIIDLFHAGKSLAECLESLLEKKNKKNAKIFFQSLCNESLEAQNEAEK